MPENTLVIFPAVENYCDFNQPFSVSSIYGVWNNRTKRFFIEGEDDLNEAILKYAEQSGSFDFLLKPEEEGYTFEDGEKIC